MSEVVRHIRAIKETQVFERIANGLKMPDHARLMMGLATRQASASPSQAKRSSPRSGQHTELLYRISASRHVDAEVIAALQNETNSIRLLDRRLGAPAVSAKLQAHIDHVDTCLRYSMRPGQRQALASVLAEASSLAGWQAIDAGKLPAAWEHYERATGAAREADDKSLLAYAAGEQAYVLLGQEELDGSVLEAALRDQVRRRDADSVWSELETERILLAAVRVGQHVFALHVLANCGSRCVFCGLAPAAFGAKRMLLAGHIKPWKDSTPSERLDPRNGLAACPADDAAFDTGMLTVNGGLRIHLARSLADAVQADPLARQYYGQPPLLEVLLLPYDAQAPAGKYLDWHQRNVFIA